MNQRIKRKSRNRFNSRGFVADRRDLAQSARLLEMALQEIQTTEAGESAEVERVLNPGGRNA